VPPGAPKPRRAHAFLSPAIVLLLLVACDSQPAAAPVPEVTLTQADVTSEPAIAPEAALLTDSGPADRRVIQRQLQEDNVKFERFSLDQGLSQSVVLASLQDSQGFMWFATQDGLNRFDGYEFVIYKHDPDRPDSLSNNFVQDILSDPAGGLWIGTNGGGLDRLEPDTGKFVHYQHDPADPYSLSSNVVLSLYRDREGVLWIGTNGGGLDRFDAESARFVHYQHDPQDPQTLSHNAVSWILQDQEGALWIGTMGGGLNRLDPETGRFGRYQNDPEDPDSLGHDSVQSIHEDKEGVLWIGTDGGGLDRFLPEIDGFVHYRHDPNDPHSLSNNQVWSIYEDRAGELWVGTFGGGLDRYDREAKRFVHYQNDPSDPESLSNNQVWSIYEDRAGGLWFGTFGGGVNRFDRERYKFRLYQHDPQEPHSLSENMVWSIYEDREGTLWVGTNGGGLNRLERDTAPGAGGEYFIHYRNIPTDTHSLSNDIVWSLLQDREGVLWVGTHVGLDRFEDDQFIHYPAEPVFTIYQDAEGQLWIGTWAGGLGRLDRKTEQLVFYQNDPTDVDSLGDNSVLSILEDGDGVLWLGTFDGGLEEFDRDAERFVHYRNDPDDPQSLSNNTVLAIHQDRQGVLWIATGGGGLNRLDRATMTFRHYTEQDGLANNTIYGILEDDVPMDEGGPNLWLSTNRGVSRFNLQTETFRNYDVGDGLQSSEFNQGSYHKSPSGEMFFGGINGFNAFFPEEVSDNAYIPPIVLTALTQGGEDVEAGMPVENLTAVGFKWPRNSFEFEFAVLNYTQPEKNQYAYMLEGFDAGWILAGSQRSGRYTNLPGGTYTLRLRGSNNDGIWNEQGHAVKITVVPPFWQTWWFRGIVTLLLLGSAFGAYRLRVRSIEARSRELESLVAARTQDLAALNAVTVAVSRSLDLQKTLDDTLDTTLQVTGMEGGGVYLLDKTASLLTIAAHRGFSPEYIPQIDGLQANEGFSGYVVQSGEPLVVRDIVTDERLSRMAAREEGFHSLVCVPLKSKGRVLGTLFAVTRDYRDFTEQDVALLTSISSHAAIAIDNARLYQDATTRLAQLTALQETTRLVVSTLDPDELLNLIIQQATTLLHADGGLVNLVDWDSHEDQVFAATGSAVALVGSRSPLEHSLSGWATLHNQPVISNQVQTDSRVARSALSWLVEKQIQCAALAPLTIKDEVVGTLVVIGKKEGKEEFSQPELDLLVAFANQAATAINNAQLLEAERKRADELDALRTTMADLTAELELSALLQAIVERAAVLLGATGGEFGLYDESDQELEIVVSYNLGEDYVGTRHRRGEGLMGLVAQTAESMIISDYSTWAGGLAAYSQIHATLATPLKVGGRLVGVFTTVSTDPDRKFTPADLHLLNLFAQQAAIAIENARLYQQAQQLAVVEERQRLARDLHDSVTQALYGVTLYSEAAIEELSLQQIDTVAEYLRELRQTSQEALAEMRLLIHELRPAVLEEEGLVAALQTRLMAVEGRAGLQTQFLVGVDGRLPPKVEEGLYRIAREALNNALKHAQASIIIVNLQRKPPDDKVILEIIDDGLGFDPATAREKGGLGLAAMAERAAELGGQLHVQRREEGGTRVLVEVST
jgi:signal transduction histidine kinase/ligand-binding sensor domain-containing protein